MGRRIEAAPNVYSMMLFNAAESGIGKLWLWVGDFSRQNNMVDIILILFLLQIRESE